MVRFAPFFSHMVQNFKENNPSISHSPDLARSRGKTRSHEIAISQKVEKCKNAPILMIFFLNNSEFFKDYQNINRFAKFLFLEKLKGKTFLWTLH